MSTPVTPNFSAEEFACRDGSPYPPEWVESRLRPLCEALEVIREAVGGPLSIQSGYRSPAHNAKVGGAAKSRHVEGDAADIRSRKMSAAELHAIVLELHAAGKLPQLGGLGLYRGWIHVDCRPHAPGKLTRWSKGAE